MLDAMNNGRFDRALDTFKAAIQSAGGGTRASDVLGHLLAAASCVLLDDVTTEHDALAQAHDALKVVAEEELSDEQECLDHMMAQLIRLHAEEPSVSIGECIARVSAPSASNDPTTKDISAQLERCGIRVEPRELLIANRHDGMEQLFADTRWARGAHARTLARLKGCTHPGNRRFAGVQSKALAIPLTHVLQHQCIAPAAPAA